MVVSRSPFHLSGTNVPLLLNYIPIIIIIIIIIITNDDIAQYYSINKYYTQILN